MAKGKRPNVPPQDKPAAVPLATTTPPSWPVFKPALPVVDLELESLVSDKVVILRYFFPQKLCRDYVAFLRTLPLITTPGRPKRGDALRVNDRFQIQDHRFADRLWAETGLKDALQYPGAAQLWGGEIVGLNPNIRVYRYTPGQFFDAHYDDANSTIVTTSTGEQIPAKTTWTLLLYLTSSTEGCVGGETIFYPHDRRSAKEAIAVRLETGMLLLHKHGDDCMLHEGSEVTAGEKWVLRTDLCVKK